MRQEILHSTLIVITLVVSFLFSKTPLVNYDLHINAFLFILLHVLKKWVLKKEAHRLTEALIYTFIISTIINTTGGVNSPFFFLLYFLLFFLSLFLEPIISISTTVVIISLSLLSSTEIQSINQFTPLLALALLTPFAMILGKLYYQERREKERNKLLQKSINLQKEDMFLFLSLILKNHIQNILKASDDFLGDHHLDEIKKNARRMQNLIDDFEKQI